MGSLWPLFLISMQLVPTYSSGVNIVGDVGDESSLMQTSISDFVAIRRHSREDDIDDVETEDDSEEGKLQQEEDAQKREEAKSVAYLASEEKDARVVPTFTINLDLAPEERFIKVAHRFKKQFHSFYNKFVNNEGGLKMAQNSALLRGKEVSELQGEVEGIAKALDVPSFVIQSQQLSFPLQSLKGPFFKYLHSMNLSLPSDEKMYAIATSSGFLKQFPTFGCTGIIARDEVTGTVWHARNLDLGFSHWLQNLTYNAIFTKNGKEIFTGQMMFPFQQITTGMRKGSNGYTYELNARYGDTAMDSKSLIQNVYQKKRKLGGWVARKILEDTDNYDDAVELFKTSPIPGKEYHIISGKDTGIILAREPDKVSYAMDLGKERYIMMTNFDYLYDDPKEWFMWEAPVSRRVRAQTLLNASKVITPELLQKVITDASVQNGATFFQSLMSIEKGTYNSTLPRCDGCECAEGSDCFVASKTLGDEKEDSHGKSEPV